MELHLIYSASICGHTFELVTVEELLFGNPIERTRKIFSGDIPFVRLALRSKDWRSAGLLYVNISVSRQSMELHLRLRSGMISLLTPEAGCHELV